MLIRRFCTIRLSLTLTLAVALLNAAVPIAAQKKQPTRRTATRSIASQVEPPNDVRLAETFKLKPDASVAMSAAFRDGVLPPALDLPVGTTELQAAILAERVAAGDDHSVPALLTALRLAGYGIRDSAGNVDYDASGWQGLAFDAWEVAAIAKLYGNGWGIGLGRFGDSLAIISPQWKRESNVEDLVSSVRAASTSTYTPVRFWANFISELGQYAEEPFDLRRDGQAVHARLDAIQMALILSRLAADIKYAGNEGDPAAEGSAPARYRTALPRLVGTSSVGEPGGTYPAFDTDEPKQPCNLGTLEQLILDLNATGMGRVFSVFTDYLKNQKAISETPGALLGAANAALILLKFVMTYAALEADISLEGGTLTRTKSIVDGERRALTAKVRLDIGKWQIANCLRPALNAAGIDFSLPVDGALAGVRVDWNLLQGGRTLGNIRQIRNGANIPSDQIVYLDTQTGVQMDDRGKHYNYTDNDGRSRIFAVGMAQPVDLTSKSVRPVTKAMAVDLDIQVKTMKITDKTGAIGTANDLAGNAIEFLSGDLPGGIVGTAAETIYRSNFGSSQVRTFPVKDWIPCDGGWRGTVTYRRVLFNTVKAEKTQDNTTLRDRFNFERDLYVARVSVSPGDKPEVLRASAQLAYRRDYYSYYVVSNESTCGNRGRRARWWQTEIRNQRWVAFDTVDAQAMLALNGSEYSLSVRLPSIGGKFESTFNTTHRGGCGVPKPPNSGGDKQDFILDSAGNGVSGIKIDPENPHVLKGSRVLPGEDGKGLVIEWNLARCK